jgi:hypothetical protein
MEKPTCRIAVIMERLAIDNRWQRYKWQVIGIVPDAGTASTGPRTIVESDERLQKLYPGFELKLFSDETEGYYLNVSSEQPCVFVEWRMNDDGEAYPNLATVSYNEAARWMDGGMQVERVPAYAELIVWMGEYVEQYYRPDVKKKRIRPKSFESKEGRYKSGM